MKSFASDNYSGIHSDIMKAIQAANINHAKAYGECEFTNRAIAKLKEHFGEDIDAILCYLEPPPMLLLCMPLQGHITVLFAHNRHTLTIAKLVPRNLWAAK
jgi:threonine aldolase